MARSSFGGMGRDCIAINCQGVQREETPKDFDRSVSGPAQDSGGGRRLDGPSARITSFRLTLNASASHIPLETVLALRRTTRTLTAT